MAASRSRASRHPRGASGIELCWVGSAWAAPLLTTSALLLASSWTNSASAEEKDAAAAAAAKPTAASGSARGAKPATEREQSALDSAKQREEEAQRLGNSGLARRLAALSARWLKVIDALSRASKLEAEADALEDERIRVQEQTDRLVTLLEQTEARRARALSRLQELGLEPSATPTSPSAPPSATPSAEDGP